MAEEEKIKCPFCAEEILKEAIKCKHCGSMLNGSVPKDTPEKIDAGLQIQKRRNTLASSVAGLALFFGIVLWAFTGYAFAFLISCIIGLIISLSIYLSG